jgi:hypothetical protein
MTHDEVLEEINKEINDIAFTNFVNPLKYLQGLRAVVELHKPEKACCLECSDIQYPCPTIKAIEMEL